MPQSPRLSVILCTYNPRLDLLERALRALAGQTLPQDAAEVIVVDNNSAPPVPAESVTRWRPGARLIREPRQGLSFARAAGIAAASAPVLCFVDDDNVLHADYLAQAVRIADARPDVGAFGGKAHGELERAVNSGFRAFLPYFGVRDYGDEPIIGEGDAWGPWEPIGAGMCVRRAAAAAFAESVSGDGRAAALGRSGASLMSGEDSLFTRIAHQMGLRAGYFPELELTHVITAPRLTYKYLARLMEGHGRSQVVLEQIAGVRHAPRSPMATYRLLLMNALHRLKSEGPTQAYGMFFWDRGRFAAERASARLADVPA